MNPMAEAELHAIVSGRVQGVYFRNNVRQIAQELNLTGTVRNLADGSVEIFAQGTKIQLEHFLKRIKGNPGLSRVDSLEPAYSIPSRRFNEFRVIK